MFITKHNKGHFKLLLLKILPDWRAFSLKGSWKSVICVHVWLDFLVWSEIKDNEARDTWGPLIMYEHSSMYTHAHTSSLSIYNICYICICYAYIYNILYIISILWSANYLVKASYLSATRHKFSTAHHNWGEGGSRESVFICSII